MKQLAWIHTLVLITSVLGSCTHEDPAKAIVGKWSFLKFYSAYTLPDSLQAELDAVNASNKGLTVRFSPSGEFESDQPDGPPENNKIADYKILPGNRLLIENDTLLILDLDEAFLKVRKDADHPDVVFGRINNTGTEPGRR